MSHRTIVAGLVTFMLAATSCQQSTGTPQTSASPTASAVSSAEAVAPSPAAVASAFPTSAAGSGSPAAVSSAAPATGLVSLVQVVQGSGIDEKKKEVSRPGAAFTSSDKALYFTVVTSDVKKGAKFRVVLIAVDAKAENGTSVKDEEGAVIDFVAKDDDFVDDKTCKSNLRIKAPDSGWPVGTYKLEITVDGQDLEAYAFEINAAQEGGTSEGGDKADGSEGAEGDDKAQAH